MQTYSKQQSLDKIAELVETFRNDEAVLENIGEAGIEGTYIRPLFRYLNWNTENTKLTHANWEFVLQDTDKNGKRPDYRVQLNGQHLFLMDAKMVKYNMHDARWQWQVYKYAYSTRNNPPSRRMDFGILTDFQEFVLLDCTFEAKQPEAVNNFRVLDWRYTDYVDQFDRLWELFERNNMLEASRDRKSGLWACYLSPKQAKANRVPPDEGFLDKLDNDKTGWRVRLAKDMKKCTPALTGEVITGAVQLLIDRLVFIKAITDRDIDDDYLTKLAECIEASGLDEDDRGWFTAAKPLFDRLNRFYNGSMFAPRPELEAVVTSNRLVRDIIRELDPNHSPYDLAILPVEILGTIYERFLGKVVRVTDQRVKLEEKPEVRKAGGVYYTPQYIVRYIVAQTVGKLLVDCKTPEDVAKLKILDPACGSGSFLLGAYNVLIEWHKSYYAAKAKPAREAAYRDANGDIRLTAKLKRQILLNNLFGVDIDQQAVEVTRFSLSLKALEETRKDELDAERNLFKETVLPDLKDNIVSGNSLIASDFSLVIEDLVRVHAFDWDVAFRKIKEAGWFDAVIGNPPYVLISPEMFDAQSIEYLRRYEVAQYKADLFHLFIQKGISLARESGRFGMIVPSTWLTLQFTDRLRRYIAENAAISEVVVFEYLVFEEADVFTALLFLEKRKPDVKQEVIVRKVRELASGQSIADTETNRERQNTWASTEGCIFETRLTGPEGKLVERLIKAFPALETVTRASLGCQAYNSSKHTREQIEKRVFHADRKAGKDYLPELAGNDVGRYEINRERGQWIKYGPWLHDYRTMDWLQGPRILIREISGPPPRAIFAAYAEETYCNYKTILNVNPSENTTFSMKYLLGILNSRLMSFLYPYISNKLVAQAFPRLSVRDVRRLRVAVPDLKNTSDRARHDRLVGMVDKMLVLMPKLRAARTDDVRATLQNAATATDRQIDALVYELYCLTEEEIRIVEGTTSLPLVNA